MTNYTITKAPEMNRKHTFKAVKYGQRTYMFQAESEADMNRWANAMSCAATANTKVMSSEYSESLYCVANFIIDHSIFLDAFTESLASHFSIISTCNFYSIEEVKRSVFLEKCSFKNTRYRRVSCYEVRVCSHLTKFNL